MEKGVKFTEEGDFLTARLFGEIDHHLAVGLREGIDGMLYRKKPKRLILDYSGVGFMDSSGIGLIIGRADVAEGMGCEVRVSGLSAHLKKLVRLSGVGKLKNLTIED